MEDDPAFVGMNGMQAEPAGHQRPWPNSMYATAASDPTTAFAASTASSQVIVTLAWSDEVYERHTTLGWAAADGSEDGVAVACGPVGAGEANGDGDDVAGGAGVGAGVGVGVEHPLTETIASSPAASIARNPTFMTSPSPSRYGSPASMVVGSGQSRTPGTLTVFHTTRLAGRADPLCTADASQARPAARDTRLETRLDRRRSDPDDW